MSVLAEKKDCCVILPQPTLSTQSGLQGSGFTYIQTPGTEGPYGFSILETLPGSSSVKQRETVCMCVCVCVCESLHGLTGGSCPACLRPVYGLCSGALLCCWPRSPEPQTQTVGSPNTPPLPCASPCLCLPSAKPLRSLCF